MKGKVLKKILFILGAIVFLGLCATAFMWTAILLVYLVSEKGFTEIPWILLGLVIIAIIRYIIKKKNQAEESSRE